MSALSSRSLLAVDVVVDDVYEELGFEGLLRWLLVTFTFDTILGRMADFKHAAAVALVLRLSGSCEGAEGYVAWSTMRSREVLRLQLYLVEALAASLRLAIRDALRRALVAQVFPAAEARRPVRGAANIRK